jgi:hypothetical protein
MKTTLRKWITSSIKIAAFTVGFALIASCADDELAADNRSQNATGIEGIAEQPSNPEPQSLSGGCPDDLTDDGCNFTSGTGRDHPNQFLMVTMMNNCRTESLPSNCVWAGNITETRNIEVDLNNCCYPFSSLNWAMNSWKALAMSNRPASNYLITNYQRINGYMVTAYGPYRMVIRVTYRKKGLCSVVGEREQALHQ